MVRNLKEIIYKWRCLYVIDTDAVFLSPSMNTTNRNKNVPCSHSLGIVVKVNYIVRSMLIHLWEQLIPFCPSFAETNLKTWPMWWLLVLKPNNQWVNEVSPSLPSNLVFCFSVQNSWYYNKLLLKFSVTLPIQHTKSWNTTCHSHKFIEFLQKVELQ